MLQTATGIPLLRFRSFPDHALVHAISTRHGGVSEPPYDTLNLSLSVHDRVENVVKNRRRLVDAVGGDPARLVSSRQEHGDSVLVIDDAFVTPDSLPSADIQITNQTGWLLSLRFADCVPLLLVEPEARVVAAVHAGWRGTLKKAAATAVSALRAHYGVDPASIWAGIGPSIGPCCYEVGQEVASLFDRVRAGVIRNGKDRPHLDLWQLNHQALVGAGIPARQIEVARLCTRCHSGDFFSHRAQGYPAGRFSAVIGLA